MDAKLYDDLSFFKAIVPNRPEHLFAPRLFPQYRNENSAWRIQRAAYIAAATEAARIVIERAARGEYGPDGVMILKILLLYDVPGGAQSQFEGDLGLPPQEEWGDRVLDWLASGDDITDALLTTWHGLLRELKEEEERRKKAI